MTSPRVIALASAKGGTGKSMIAANIGVFLASLGKRVVLIDAAFGCGTLHCFAGVREPNRSLADFFSDKESRLEDMLNPTLITNLWIVSGEKDPAWAANPRPHQLDRLREQIRELDVDTVIVDLSAGTRENVLNLFLDADTSLVVTSAEPSAIEMSYRFIKAVFVRLLRRSERGHLGKMSVEEARGFEGGIPAPVDLLDRARAEYGDDSEEASTLREHMDSMLPYLVLNNARSRGDMELGKDIATAVTRRLGIRVPYLGYVEYDDAVWVSLRRRRPVLVEQPESRASKCIEKLSRQLLAMNSDGFRDPQFPGDSYYDLLEVEPTASEEIIRRAHRHVTQVYAPDSVIIDGLYDTHRLESLRGKIEEAYAVLMNPSRRKGYDLTLFPDGIPSESASVAPVRVSALVPPIGDRPKAPEVDEGTIFSGAVLAEFRKSLGLELIDISDKTKISMNYLQAIEQESYDSMPAPVYLRGFLGEYAKMLQLDVEQVLETYLHRFQVFQEDK